MATAEHVSVASPGAPAAPASAVPRLRGRGVAVLLVLICAVAAALRFATLGAQSFDYDESYTVGTVLGGSLGHALHTIPITESSPPLYYVLAWLWSQVFGLGEVGIRSLSAVLGTALVPVAFFIGRRLGSPRGGLIAALLVAVNPLMVWYSQEARTYSLLALLSALSFWAFIRALDQPEPRTMALWAAASAGAVLSHYFAGFLVLTEAIWLLVATRRRQALLASAAVGAVGLALVPLAARQADHRTEWIERIPLGSRVKEVAKKWATGEIAPTHNWQLVVIGLLVGLAMYHAARRLTAEERRAVILAAGTGAGAVLLPLVVDIGGLHYLISKNLMPALTVLLIAAGLLLGARRASWVGLAGSAAACAFFLAITLDGAIDPALQRPDYRAAAKALGAPARDQVVVTPNLGRPALALYRRGGAEIPGQGWPTRQVVVVEPLPRADVSQRRPPTPAAPPGFVFTGRKDALTYTLICFGSSALRAAAPGPLIALASGGGARRAQIWQQASRTVGGSAETSSVCGPPH